MKEHIFIMKMIILSFEKFHEKIWFNATARVKIGDIKPVLEENVQSFRVQCLTL